MSAKEVTCDKQIIIMPQCTCASGHFMYMCVVVHCVQHQGISTTGAFIT